MNPLRNNRGFTLLEVLIAMSILALGFILIIQLFSGGARLAGASDQYLKGIALANHKFSELEIQNFEVEEYSGAFKDQGTYRWELAVEPYTTPHNNAEEGIQLSEINLKVIWLDGTEEKNVQLASLRTVGKVYPAYDTVLAGTGSGISGNLGNNQSAFATSSDPPSGPISQTGTGGNLSKAAPGALPPSATANEPAVDPNFRFDISGLPVGPPTGAPGLIGVNPK